MANSLARGRQASQPAYSFSGKGLRDPLPGCLLCFTEGTEVATAGGEKPIEAVQPGDGVWAYNGVSGQSELQPVTAAFSREVDELVVVSAGGDTMEATVEHPFWVEGRGWIRADELKPGDSLRSLSGRMVPVSAVERKEGRFTVYNFEVAGPHDYFVSDEAVLVHNCRKLVGRMDMAGKRHSVSKVWFDKKGFPKFESKFDVKIPKELNKRTVSDYRQFKNATAQLKDQLSRNPSLKSMFTQKQLKAIEKGKGRIPGHTWHHHQDGSRLQLVERWKHSKTGHSGGRKKQGGRP
jgi:hypothetical protein